jgi:chloramphenicol 3-O-phosphotransferase
LVCSDSISAVGASDIVGSLAGSFDVAMAQIFGSETRRRQQSDRKQGYNRISRKIFYRRYWDLALNTNLQMEPVECGLSQGKIQKSR